MTRRRGGAGTALTLVTALLLGAVVTVTTAYDHDLAPERRGGRAPSSSYSADTADRHFDKTMETEAADDEWGRDYRRGTSHDGAGLGGLAPDDAENEGEAAEVKAEEEAATASEGAVESEEEEEEETETAGAQEEAVAGVEETAEEKKAAATVEEEVEEEEEEAEGTAKDEEDAEEAEEATAEDESPAATPSAGSPDLPPYPAAPAAPPPPPPAPPPSLVNRVKHLVGAGPCKCCPPNRRFPTHLELSLPAINGILRRGEQYLRGPASGPARPRPHRQVGGGGGSQRRNTPLPPLLRPPRLPPPPTRTSTQTPPSPAPTPPSPRSRPTLPRWTPRSQQGLVDIARNVIQRILIPRVLIYI